MVANTILFYVKGHSIIQVYNICNSCVKWPTNNSVVTSFVSVPFPPLVEQRSQRSVVYQIEGGGGGGGTHQTTNQTWHKNWKKVWNGRKLSFICIIFFFCHLHEVSKVAVKRVFFSGISNVLGSRHFVLHHL